MSKLRFLTICGCIIISILLQCVESSNNPIDFGKPPMWLHPCHYGTVNIDPAVDYAKANKAEEAKLYDRLFDLTEKALSEINNLRAKWADHEFHDFYLYKMNLLWGISIPYGFLPNREETKKEFDGPSPLFQYKQRNELIPKLYLWFQKVAIGLEQLVHDQFLYTSQFANDFMESYKSLQLVLCELDTAMFELGIQKKNDADRELMVEEERVVTNERYRQLRDFTIIREYCNLLQYLDYVMVMLKKIVPSPDFQETFTPSPPGINVPLTWHW